TQKLSSPAPMVVGGSPCESRTPPGNMERQDMIEKSYPVFFADRKTTIASKGMPPPFIMKMDF
ncbi:hypothetical protein KM885_12455, partial [Oceanobacillus caeni]|uniref:hypothetical protein n=1 Tax=Oceanobacillus caeni TaxID=405946 RepID=UPI001C24DCEB